MPFDPFFSSAHKEHFVKNPRYDTHVIPEVRRIEALPDEERFQVCRDLMIRQSRHELSEDEYHVLKRLNFTHNHKRRARQRVYNVKRQMALQGKGEIIFRGYNTT